MSSATHGYIMGHSDHERRRLSLQALTLNPFTTEFFHRAGIAPGMRVLDLGCGVGEVSLIAARIVGPQGFVTGVDIDPGGLAIARGRAAAEGFDHVRFAEANVAEFREGAHYDAVVGRLILIHMPDAAALIRHAASVVRPGGIVAFQDFDLSRYIAATPPEPLIAKCGNWFAELFNQASSRSDVGMHIFQYLVDAGLEEVQSRAEIPMGGGADSLIYEWFAETARTLLPKLEAAGIVTAAEVEIDTLAQRMRDEAVAAGGCALGPILVSASARKP